MTNLYCLRGPLKPETSELLCGDRLQPNPVLLCTHIDTRINDHIFCLRHCFSNYYNFINIPTQVSTMYICVLGISTELIIYMQYRNIILPLTTCIFLYQVNTYIAMALTACTAYRQEKYRTTWKMNYINKMVVWLWNCFGLSGMTAKRNDHHRPKMVPFHSW